MIERHDKYEWMGVTMEVTRVAKDGSWADFLCSRAGAQVTAPSTWPKRHKLPLPAEAVKIDGK